MDLDSAADELYVISPAGFVRRRAELAAEAQRASEKATAAAIKKLHKPTLGAWLANLLAHQRTDQIDELLRLGELLRTAHLNLAGPELRQLAQQRHEVIGTLVGEAHAIAREAGSPVNEDATRELEVTLSAALADPDAAKAIRTGRLTSGLSYSGFGPLEGVAAATAPPKERAGSQQTVSPTAKSTADDERQQRRREAAEQALRDEETAAADAQRTLDELFRVSGELQEELGRREDEVKDLELQLGVARTAVAEGEHALRTAEKKRGDAEEALQAAGKRVAQAEGALKRLKN